MENTGGPPFKETHRRKFNLTKQKNCLSDSASGSSSRIFRGYSQISQASGRWKLNCYKARSLLTSQINEISQGPGRQGLVLAGLWQLLWNIAPRTVNQLT